MNYDKKKPKIAEINYAVLLMSYLIINGTYCHISGGILDSGGKIQTLRWKTSH